MENLTDNEEVVLSSLSPQCEFAAGDLFTPLLSLKEDHRT